MNNVFGTILLADDEPTFLASTSELLRREGYVCDCAETGAETLKKLKNKNYDLLIADIKMPGNSNLELIREVNYQHPATSVLLITGYPSQQTAIDSIELCITAYFVKPFDFNLLLKNVQSTIKTNKLFTTVKKTKGSLLEWVSEMENIELAMENGKLDIFENSLNSFLTVNAEKISKIFGNIQFVSNLIVDANTDTKVCDAMRLGNIQEKIEKLLDDDKNRACEIDKKIIKDTSGNFR